MLYFTIIYILIENFINCWQFLWGHINKVGEKSQGSPLKFIYPPKAFNQNIVEIYFNFLGIKCHNLRLFVLQQSSKNAPSHPGDDTFQ